MKNHLPFKEKYGPTALIAGASEGMGAAYARALAARGLDLILIARRPEPLDATAAQIRKLSGVNVQTITCDLAAPDATQQIIDATGDKPVDFLVYNAALSYIGPYLSTGPSTHTNIATVNMLTPLTLLHHFARTTFTFSTQSHESPQSRLKTYSPSTLFAPKTCA